MTKSLIDKAIEQYNYVWPKGEWDDSEDTNKNAIVIALRNYGEDGQTWIKDRLYTGGTACDKKYFNVVCTKEQFEQRVEELQLKENDWYDYESQKAIKLPPVGEKVSVFLHWSGMWSGWVVIVGYDGDGVIWRNGVDKQSYVYSPIDEIRPLDLYSRKADQERKKTVEAVMKYWVILDTGTTETFEKLYDAGFLKLPEGYNE